MSVLEYFREWRLKRQNPSTKTSVSVGTGERSLSTRRKHNCCLSYATSLWGFFVSFFFFFFPHTERQHRKAQRNVSFTNRKNGYDPKVEMILSSVFQSPVHGSAPICEVMFARLGWKIICKFKINSFNNK